MLSDRVARNAASMYRHVRKWDSIEGHLWAFPALVAWLGMEIVVLGRIRVDSHRNKGNDAKIGSVCIQLFFAASPAIHFIATGPSGHYSCLPKHARGGTCHAAAHEPC